jgi:phosphoserine aminotransferase
VARIYNFSAGPAILPAPVLERAREELRGWRSTGVSVMEMSHRGDDFIGISEKAEADLRALLGVPTDYKVLFLAGGASAQFAAAPMNLWRNKKQASYAASGPCRQPNRTDSTCGRRPASPASRSYLGILGRQSGVPPRSVGGARTGGTPSPTN